MTSKEMEERSGVPRANIRYYEAEGLLSPSRAKNGYREYSEEDLAALEKIKLLRRLGVTIEELKELTAGRLELAAVLDRRLAEVGGERASLDRVEEVCGRLRTAGETFAGLDAGTYLDALDAPALPPEGGEVWWKTPHGPALPETDALPVCTSIPRRLFARLFDELGMRMLVLCAMALLGTNPVSHATAITLLAGFLLLFVEPLLLHLLGTTPGKALMGLRLEAPGGRKLTYAEGFSRYLLLLWYGLGLGIPIFNLVRYYQCAKRCGEGEPQTWDTDIAYIEKPFRWVNPAAYLLAAVLVLAAAETVNALVPGLLPVLSPALPLGLSFYVFTAIGYCADVAAGKVESEKNPIRFAVFLAFFGHGPSGPIVRYGQQATQLDPGSETRRVSADRFCYGIKRLVLGLAKKAIIADQLALIYAKVASVPAATLPAPILVLGYTAYMMKLYFDFSGYSDMAIGIGEFFGITLPENFEYPYLACSVGEYWRRWHISLSSWFRDYVYIPLGGSRCRLRRTCLNLLIVFALTGLWHGAAWQYVVFGLLHGIILCMERLGLRRALEQLPRLFRHLYTVVLLWLTLVIFGAPGLSEGLAVLKGIFTWQSGAKGYTLAAFADTKLLLILAASFLLCGPVQALCPKLKAALYAKKAPSPAGMAGLLVLLFLGLMRVTAGTYSAFIYFQF